MNDEQGDLFKELECKIRDLYPFFKFGKSERSIVDGDVISQQYEFHIGQDVIRDSEYGVSRTDKFIHYTTLNSFCEILNSGELRLFNLYNLNDPYEFNHLIKEYDLKVDEGMIEYFKKTFFVSSFCRYNESEGDDFNLWRLYGDNGLGVGIVFELMNKSDNWGSCLFGNVNYDSKNVLSQKITKAVALANEYVEKGLDRIPRLLAQLLLYHKKEIWSIEKESRLSVFFDHNGYNQERDYDNPIFKNTLKTFIRPSGVVSSCITLPLEEKMKKIKKPNITDEDFELINKLPRLQIEKVILGYGHNEKNVGLIKEYCMHLMSSKWNNPRIIAEKSRLFD